MKKPLGVVFVVHGLGEHVSRYEHVAKALNAQGYSVYGMDHQGHGLSEGDRAHVRDMADLIEDYLTYINSIDVKGVPRFLIGHSLGGLIGINIALKSQHLWQGIVISAAALSIPPPPAILLKLAPLLSAYLPKLQLTPLDIDELCTNEETLKRYRQDPLVYRDGVRVRLAYSMIQLMETTATQFSKITCPVFIVHGRLDTICLPDGSKAFFDASASKDKTLKMYAGMKHEIFNETQATKVITDVVEWIQARTPGNPSLARESVDEQLVDTAKIHPSSLNPVKLPPSKLDVIGFVSGFHFSKL